MGLLPKPGEGSGLRQYSRRDLDAEEEDQGETHVIKFKVHVSFIV